MAGTEFKFTGDWRKLKYVVDPKRFETALQQNMLRATQFNGMLVVAEIRRRIRAKRYAPNAPLTVLLKRSTKPLVDDGDLFSAVTSNVMSPTHVFVGILRQARASDGTSLVNIAQLLHEGGTIRVTEAMRGMFALLADYAAGRIKKEQLDGRALEIANELKGRIKQIRPFKATTTTLIIPPRRFLLEVFRDPAVLKKIKANWEKALKATLKAASSSAPPGPPSPAENRKAAGRVKSSSRSGKVAPPKQARNRSAAARKGWNTRRSKASKVP